MLHSGVERAQRSPFLAVAGPLSSVGRDGQPRQYTKVPYKLPNVAFAMEGEAEEMEREAKDMEGEAEEMEREAKEMEGEAKDMEREAENMER